MVRRRIANPLFPRFESGCRLFILFEPGFASGEPPFSFSSKVERQMGSKLDPTEISYDLAVFTRRGIQRVEGDPCNGRA